MQGLSPQVDPFQLLKTADKIKVKQLVDIIEVLGCCEKENTYDIFTYSNNQNVYIARAKEESSCFQRYCCPGESRAFKVHFKYPNSDNTFLTVDRPFKCTCCCLARPIMTNTLTNGQKIGNVKNPCTCCSPLFEITDENDNVKYTVTIRYCQLGFCVRGCNCYEVTGEIYSIKDNQNPIGTFLKKAKCCQETFTDANTFVITIPVDLSVNDKLNLVCCVVMIDFRYYEESPTDKGNVSNVTIH